MTVCPMCNSRCVEDSQFCPNCGAELRETVITCPLCSAINQRESKFCRKCGNFLSEKNQLTCGVCATANNFSNEFCYNCGTKLSKTNATVKKVLPEDNPINRDLINAFKESRKKAKEIKKIRGVLLGIFFIIGISLPLYFVETRLIWTTASTQYPLNLPKSAFDFIVYMFTLFNGSNNFLKLFAKPQMPQYFMAAVGASLLTAMVLTAALLLSCAVRIIKAKPYPSRRITPFLIFLFYLFSAALLTLARIDFVNSYLFNEIKVSLSLPFAVYGMCALSFIAIFVCNKLITKDTNQNKKDQQQ